MDELNVTAVPNLKNTTRPTEETASTSLPPRVVPALEKIEKPAFLETSGVPLSEPSVSTSMSYAELYRVYEEQDYELMQSRFSSLARALSRISTVAKSKSGTSLDPMEREEANSQVLRLMKDLYTHIGLSDSVNEFISLITIAVKRVPGKNLNSLQLQTLGKVADVGLQNITMVNGTIKKCSDLLRGAGLEIAIEAEEGHDE